MTSETFSSSGANPEASEFFVIPRLLLANHDLPEPFARAVGLVANGGYLTASSFLQQLTEDELHEALSQLVLAQSSKEVFSVLALTVVLMACHEGLVACEDDRIRRWMSRFHLLVQLEIQARSGRVRIDYRRVTLEFAVPAEIPLATDSPLKLEDVSVLFIDGDKDAF